MTRPMSQREAQFYDVVPRELKRIADALEKRNEMLAAALDTLHTRAVPKGTDDGD